MKVQKSKIAYSSPQVKIMFVRVECAVTASYGGNATKEDYESEDLFY